MKPVLIGYFPKKTSPKTEYLNASNVEIICSASTCISEEPEGCIDHWKHNDFFLYNSIKKAKSILKNTTDKDEYDIYAYKQYPIRIQNGEIINEEITSPNAKSLDKKFEFLGYDAVSNSVGSGFECSPLSCNSGAETIKVNKFCLFETFEEALLGAKEFSKRGWEPGPYYIVEVFRLKK